MTLMWCWRLFSDFDRGSAAEPKTERRPRGYSLQFRWNFLEMTHAHGYATFQTCVPVISKKLKWNFSQYIQGLLVAFDSSLLLPSIEVWLRGLQRRISINMPWSQAHQTRLAHEKGLLENHFRGRVTWIDPRGDTRVEIQVTYTNDKQYVLRIYIPSDYHLNSGVMGNYAEMLTP